MGERTAINATENCSLIFHGDIVKLLNQPFEN